MHRACCNSRNSRNRRNSTYLQYNSAADNASCKAAISEKKASRKNASRPQQVQQQVLQLAQRQVVRQPAHLKHVLAVN